MFSPLPLLVGLLLAAASLTPSLIPRDWLTQGLVAGASMASGYVATQFFVAIWRTLEIPEPPARWARIGHLVLAVPVLALVGFCVGFSVTWQNSIRERMSMPLLEAADTLRVIGVALAVFLALFILGLAFQVLFNLLRRRLARYIPARSANVLGLALAVLVAVFLTRDGVVNNLFRMLDASQVAAQHLMNPSQPAPAEDWRSGSAASQASWDLMGTPGRNYVLSGPSAADITALTGKPAKEPLRIYVGRAQNASAEERARIALAEMERVGAFERKVLVVVSPTGTGWMDPASFDALEYMHGGDIATVAVQYSFLQSPMALIFETSSGPDQAVALMRAVYDHWRTIPESRRPKLYMHGLSLGAWSSMQAFNPFQMMNEPVDGAFWVGPPFPSALWQQANSARQPGSPYVLPEVDDGEVIRYSSQFAAPERSGKPWGRLRILFLQYASDAITFYSPASLWRAPEWMREPPAADVSPRLRFIPIVTQFQLAADMLIATSTPAGFGHLYDAKDYIDGWVSVTAPEGWTAADTARLKAHCGTNGLVGCANG
ncbi:alpha/beta-hydrolase family protein [Paracoccus sp. (in: a-proteobacteria)]|uniref:alpha/beta hydrolase n=1 Tax=Paracoccus sp. TaxID=267 RepID=UPI00321F62B8